MSNLFFTSDMHYGHGNIIKYCNRPFIDVVQMNETLIANHNSIVKPDDVIWMLGDISMMYQDRTDRLLSRLNGKKHLVFGNHDKLLRKKIELQKYFESVQDYKELSASINGQSYFIVMSHYPLLTWNRSYRGSIMLHGHCHGNLNHLNEKIKRLDVGVDSHNYRPISLQQVVGISNAKSVETATTYGAIDE